MTQHPMTYIASFNNRIVYPLESHAIIRLLKQYKEADIIWAVSFSQGTKSLEFIAL